MTTDGVLQNAAKQGHMRCSEALKIVLSWIKSKDPPGISITKRKITIDVGHIVYNVYEEMSSHSASRLLSPGVFSTNLQTFVELSIHQICSQYAQEFSEEVYFDIVWDHPDERPPTKGETLEARMGTDLKELLRRLLNEYVVEPRKAKLAELKEKKRRKAASGEAEKKQKSDGDGDGDTMMGQEEEEEEENFSESSDVEMEDLAGSRQDQEGKREGRGDSGGGNRGGHEKRREENRFQLRQKKAHITRDSVIWPKAPVKVEYNNSFDHSLQFKGFDRRHLRHLQAKTEADTCIALSALVYELPPDSQPDPHDARSRLEYISYSPLLARNEYVKFICSPNQSYLVCPDSDFATVTDPKHFRWVINQAPLGLKMREKYTLPQAQPLPPPLPPKKGTSKPQGSEMLTVYRVWDFEKLVADKKVFVTDSQLGRAGEAVFYGNDHSKGVKKTGRAALGRATELLQFISSRSVMEEIDNAYKGDNASTADNASEDDDASEDDNASAADNAPNDEKVKLEEKWRNLVSSLPPDPTRDELTLKIFQERRKASYGLVSGPSISKTLQRTKFLEDSETRLRDEIGTERQIAAHQTAQALFQGNEPRNHALLSIKHSVAHRFPEASKEDREQLDAKELPAKLQPRDPNEKNKNFPISVKKIPTYGKELEDSLSKIRPSAILEGLFSPPKPPPLPEAKDQTFKGLKVDMKTLSFPLKSALRDFVSVSKGVSDGTTFAVRNLLIALHEAEIMESTAVARVAAFSLRLIGAKDARLFLKCGTSFEDMRVFLPSIATQMVNYAQGKVGYNSTLPLVILCREAAEEDAKSTGETFTTTNPQERLERTLSSCASAFSRHLKNNLAPEAHTLLPLLSAFLRNPGDTLGRLISLTEGLFPNFKMGKALPPDPSAAESYLLARMGASRNKEVRQILSRFAMFVLSVRTPQWRFEPQSFLNVDTAEDNAALERLQSEFERILNLIYIKPENFDIDSDITNFDLPGISPIDVHEASVTFAKAMNLLRKVLSISFVELAMHAVEGSSRLNLPSTIRSTRSSSVPTASTGVATQAFVNRTLGQHVTLLHFLSMKPRTGDLNSSYVWKVNKSFTWILLYLSDSIQINFDPKSMQFDGGSLSQVVEIGRADHGSPPILSILRDFHRNLENQRQLLEKERRKSLNKQKLPLEAMKPVAAPPTSSSTDKYDAANIASRRHDGLLHSIDKSLAFGGGGFDNLPHLLPEARIAHLGRSYPDKVFFEQFAAIRYFTPDSTQDAQESTVRFKLREDLVISDSLKVSKLLSDRFGGGGMGKGERVDWMIRNSHEVLWFLFDCHRPRTLVPHRFCLTPHELRIIYYNPRVCPRRIEGDYTNDIDFTETLVPNRPDYDKIILGTVQERDRSSTAQPPVPKTIPTFFAFQPGQPRAIWVAARAMSQHAQQLRGLPRAAPPTSLLPLDFEFVDPDSRRPPKLFNTLEEKVNFDARQTYNNDTFRFHMDPENLKSNQKLIVITNDKGDVNPAACLAYRQDTQESHMVMLGRGRFVGAQVSEDKVRNSLKDFTGWNLLGQFLAEVEGNNVGELSKQIENFNKSNPGSTISPRLARTSRLITDYTRTRSADNERKLRSEISTTLKEILGNKEDLKKQNVSFKLIYIEGVDPLPKDSTGRHGPRKAEGVSKIIVEELDKLGELHAFGLREDDSSQVCGVCGIYGLIYPRRMVDGSVINRACFHPDCQNFFNRDINSARVQMTTAHATALTGIYGLSPAHLVSIFRKRIPLRQDGQRLPPRTKREKKKEAKKREAKQLQLQDKFYGLPEGVSRRGKGMVDDVAKEEEEDEEDEEDGIESSEESSWSDEDEDEEDAADVVLQQDTSVLAHPIPSVNNNNLVLSVPSPLPSSVSLSDFPAGAGFDLLF